ncbi:MAG TPA: helix-turn-helix domain-containing protein [Chryseosolibacter sp.]|nr:helix-turn-helix domain-containing protein [Chryseosolibacter sp.]
MFYLAGVGLAVFLDLLLLAKRNKSRADWILAGWLVFIALHLLMVTFIRSAIYPHMWGIDLPLPLVHGPFLFLYTRALTGRHVRTRHMLIHLLLPFACYVYLVSFISRPASEKIFVYENGGIGYEAFLFFRAISIPVSGIVYILLSLYTLRQHHRAIVEEFSSVNKINLGWLRNLIIGLSLIWILVLIGNDDWIFSATVVFTFFVGFFGIRQGVIFNNHLSIAETIDEKTTVSKDDQPEPTAFETPKYQKSGLTEARAETLHHQLISLMAAKKLYRNSEFSLTDLADHLNIPANHISQVINEREGKNFYDYVNSLRIQEFMENVRQPESRKITLFALAQQSGFNSKSSFNRYFKKITGQLPSEYVKDFLITEK